MAKGALAIGLGSAMLLGGGGTLAVWNETQNANAGTIVAGNLDLNAGKGTWTNTSGATIDINSYKVVPGEQLTFTQNVEVKLEGDQMKATLDITRVTPNTFTGSKLPEVSLTNEAGAVVDQTNITPETDGKFTAKAVFIFNPNTTGQQDVGAKLDLTQVSYVLTQVAK